MAKKKNKRPNLSQDTLERARAELRGERVEPQASVQTVPTNGSSAVQAKAKAKPARASLSRRVPSIDELRSEYSYVLHDLRNLLILAAILLVIIVAAAVFLPRPTG
jgi:hypothetical protein